MCVHTLGFLELFQGLGITEPEAWGNSLSSGKSWGHDQPLNPLSRLAGLLGAVEVAQGIGKETL